MKKQEQYETIRIWLKSVKNLRMIYALTGETMVRILDRIISHELQRIYEEDAASIKGEQNV